MTSTRPTNTERLNEHEQRLDGQDKALLIIQQQFASFQELTREQLNTINKVVDSFKETKVDVARLQEKSVFDEWKRAFITGLITLVAGSALGIVSTILYQALQHLH
jgi:hypothetical protein